MPVEEPVKEIILEQCIEPEPDAKQQNQADLVADLADIKLGQDLAKLRLLFLNGEFFAAKEFLHNRLLVSYSIL